MLDHDEFKIIHYKSSGDSRLIDEFEILYSNKILINYSRGYLRIYNRFSGIYLEWGSNYQDKFDKSMGYLFF